MVDATTGGSPDHPILVINLGDDPCPSFHSTPAGVQSIENNLSIANMDYMEFADAAGDDGVFRGF